ncbi:class I SAM-dependent RNA methyltransferase [Calidifontibacter sp. DB0510]|uniref:Class I SAM-dependent RNA methyltransferase n=1 Tax=Metallococcus carri TaxID=1656884 RepID=A0A967B2N6_9MICO|nr:class I SAM-dependent RNA methyltransferase [Metallococcus carri]NHN56902.1 class I SAM-dependent RNA methyltransferase [Metallococcus carri]NOP37647.1 class I SAM-dependent RNA methyltransferase [Calidifontibacter sp. DB2511S]
MSGRGRDRCRPRSRTQQGRSLKGERLTLEVGEVAHGGHCVARHEGRVVFVRHALPGEQVVALVTDGSEGSRFLRADAIEVLTASPHRVQPPCPYAGPGRCGGCDWQHATPAYGRALKTHVVQEQLRRLAGLDWDGEVEALPSETDDGLRWRTRLELTTGARGRLGLRKHRSHDVVTIEDCLIAVPQVTATGVLAESMASGVTGADVAVASDGSVTVVELPDTEPAPITEVVRERAFTVDARGFWQVHPSAAPTFVDVVLAGLDPQPGERALDLYCGVGLFAAFLADAVGERGRVIGVEGDATAVEHARANLAGLPQAEVFGGDVAAVLAEESFSADLVVLDPPRAGAGREVIAAIAAAAPRAIAYVACDPAALARDLAYAAEHGYWVRSLRAFDAFPMTQHIECIAILQPGPAGPHD